MKMEESLDGEDTSPSSFCSIKYSVLQLCNKIFIKLKEYNLSNKITRSNSPVSTTEMVKDFRDIRYAEAWVSTRKFTTSNVCECFAASSLEPKIIKRTVD
jgi:hypothetical protein